MRALSAALLCLAVVVIPPLPLNAADDETTTYFRQLRARGLYTLAETYCRQQLERERLAPALRVDLTCELIQTLVEHATRTAEGNAAELWQQAQSAVEGFLAAHPDNPWRLLVEAQGAFVLESAAQWQGALAELTPADRDRARQVSTRLEQAVGALRSLYEKIQDRLQQPAARRSSDAGELRPAELRALSHQTGLRLGSALMELASRLPADNTGRTDLIGEAQKLLKSLPEPSDEDESSWNSRLLLVRSYRLLNDDARLARQVAAAEKLNPPLAVRDRMLAERVGGLLALRKPGVADAWLAERERSGVALPGELLFLRVAILGDLHHAAALRNDDELTKRLVQRFEAAADRCLRDAGDYWGQRSEALRILLHDTRQFGPELAALVRSAQAQFAEGNIDEAVQTYGRAAQYALKSGRGDFAFQFGFTRASIELQGKRWDDAAIDLKDLVEQFPQHEKTPDAHLLYAYALGRLYEAHATKSARELYTAALEVHRRRFAEHVTSGEATWMLAQFQERRGQFTAALPLYREVPHDHARGPAAEVAIARCCEMILQRLRDLNQPVNPWEDASIEEIGRFLEARAAEPTKWTADQAEIAVRLARILLRKHQPDFPLAEAWLERLTVSLQVLAEPANLPKDQALRVSAMQAQTSQLRIMSLAGQRKFQEAREMLHRVSSAAPQEWLFILEALSSLTSDDAEDPFHDLGELQLEAALALERQRDKLADTDQQRLDECLTKAYAAVRKFPQALEIQQRLLAKSPKDKVLLTGYANLLRRCGTPECLQQAQATWRKLETLYTIGAPEWFAARYELCRCLFDLKETAEACKLLKFTRVVYPELGGPALAAKFTELEARCSTGKSK